MPCDFICTPSPLSQESVQHLWNAICTTFPERTNDHVSVRCVSESEIQDLNRIYRKKDIPTNVLTFSYTDDDPYEHDIAVCIEVAQQEAAQRGVTVVDYIALLIVHAMLHAVGMDHEQSEVEDQKTAEMERRILFECGFVPTALSGGILNAT